mmetsp:Transcript_16214/g.19746  ORF Transcript_16214/g.19746 Transcript_16214/m.19746 type:complete len:101 (-) Transcript_16214:28-330(-)
MNDCSIFFSVPLLCETTQTFLLYSKDQKFLPLSLMVFLTKRKPIGDNTRCSVFLGKKSVKRLLIIFILMVKVYSYYSINDFRNATILVGKYVIDISRVDN